MGITPCYGLGEKRRKRVAVKFFRQATALHSVISTYGIVGFRIGSRRFSLGRLEKWEFQTIFSRYILQFGGDVGTRTAGSRT